MTFRAGPRLFCWAMLRQPLALLQALVSPPGATVGFVLALTLPLVLFVPLLSVDAALLMLVPLLIALLRKGDRPCRSPCATCWLWCPAFISVPVLWWQRHPGLWSQPWLRRCWTAAL